MNRENNTFADYDDSAAHRLQCVVTVVWQHTHVSKMVSSSIINIGFPVYDDVTSGRFGR